MAKRSTTTRKPRAVKKAPTAGIITRPDLDHAAVAARAYELFLDGGSRHGRDLDHWLQAERELRGQVLTSAA